MRTGHGRTPGLRRVARDAAFCGIGAGLAAQAALLLAARAEGKPLARPFNATSHWLHGEQAGRRGGADLSHTATGAATNQAAAMFWGGLFALHLANRQEHGTAEILRDAAVMGVIASIVDYGLIPRRLSPGWELALGKTSVALTMAAVALGLALGGIAARATEE